MSSKTIKKNNIFQHTVALQQGTQLPVNLQHTVALLCDFLPLTFQHTVALHNCWAKHCQILLSTQLLSKGKICHPLQHTVALLKIKNFFLTHICFPKTSLPHFLPPIFFPHRQKNTNHFLNTSFLATGKHFPNLQQHDCSYSKLLPRPLAQQVLSSKHFAYVDNNNITKFLFFFFYRSVHRK